MAKKKLTDDTEQVSKKEKAMELLKSLNKDYKKTVLKMASDLEVKEKLSTPNKELNEFIGGGFQCGNYSLIVGANSAGKTTLMLQTIVEAQKKGKVCCFIDLEHKFDPDWARKLGVCLEDLIFVNDIDYAEDAMEVVNKLCQNQVVDLVVIDSLHAMSVKGEQITSKGVEKEFTSETMAILARKLSEFFRRTANAVAKAKTAVLIVAQVRMDLSGFIAKMGTSGGHAKDHWTTIGIMMRRGAKADNPVAVTKFINPETGRENSEKTVVGHDVVITITKDHVFGCKRTNSQLHVPFFYESGFAPLPVEFGVLSDNVFKVEEGSNEE